MIKGQPLSLSGERFSVLYRLQGDKDTAYAKAVDICQEQSIEFAVDLVDEGPIKDHILGKIIDFYQMNDKEFGALISFAVESTSGTLTQFLNVVFGNISIKPGIKVEKINLSDLLLEQFKGPRYGIKGIRELLEVPERPLLCTAIKPMGLNPRELAEMAYQFALGGIDIVKDDHGLTNQIFSPFKERVERCTEAVEKANQQTGYKCIYAPNITAPADEVIENAYFAKKTGAKGLLLSTALVGFDTLRVLADDEKLGLAIISHPAFMGSFVTCPTSGISSYALFGQITRLTGADAAICPSFTGRFVFPREECELIVRGSIDPMGHIKPIFPVPGGGVTIEMIPEICEVFGKDVIILSAGGLHRPSPDLTANARLFLKTVQSV